MAYQSNPQQNRSNLPYPHDNYYAQANALYQSGQTISSAGGSASHWPTQALSSDHHLAYPPTSSTNTNGTATGDALRSNPPTHAQPSGLPSSPYPSQQFHPPRRTLTLGRSPEELHIPPSSSAMSDVQNYGPPPSYAGDNVTINVQPSTPRYGAAGAGNNVPGALQPGMSNRPPPLSSNTAPGSIPTLPQISTQLSQPPLSARPTMSGQSHSYSRSSPGTMDQPRYKPFSNTPETPKYSSPSTSSYMPHPPQGGPSYSPLGLADIRPRGDTGFSDTPLSGIPSDTQDPQNPGKSTYYAPWPIYALDWCKWPPRSNSGVVGKIAMGSYLEDNHNYIQILDAYTALSDDGAGAETCFEFVKTAEATHSYPVTRILWEPPSTSKQNTDLLATSGDHLRLWSLPSDAPTYQSNSITRPKEQPLQKLSPLALLSNSKSPEHTAPITSLDWNVVSPSLIITSSIDTTCTIWDIPTLTAKTQLIAHDKEVFDVRFCAASVDVFVSCGADGSVRMFDLRSLEHSTIIYEPSDKSDKSAQLSPEPPLNTSPTRNTTSQSMTYPPPLLRIAASPHDAHLLATFSQDSSTIRVLDVRQPGQALLELKGHAANVNCIEWSAVQRGVLASGADDCCVLLWDLMGSSGTVAGGQTPASGGVGQERGPTASWECGYEISNLSWAPTAGCIGVCGGKGFWGVQM